MTTAEVATAFTELLRKGEYAEAGEAFWAPEVSSVEPMDLPGGIEAVVEGIDGVREKGRTWFGASRIDDLRMEGPFVTGDQFALVMKMTIVDRKSGEGRPFRELAVYTVRDGRIVEERYFYDA